MITREHLQVILLPQQLPASIPWSASTRQAGEGDQSGQLCNSPGLAHIEAADGIFGPRCPMYRYTAPDRHTRYTRYICRTCSEWAQLRTATLATKCRKAFVAVAVCSGLCSGL